MTRKMLGDERLPWFTRIIFVILLCLGPTALYLAAEAGRSLAGWEIALVMAFMLASLVALAFLINDYRDSRDIAKENAELAAQTSPNA